MFVDETKLIELILDLTLFSWFHHRTAVEIQGAQEGKVMIDIQIDTVVADHTSQITLMIEALVEVAVVEGAGDVMKVTIVTIAALLHLIVTIEAAVVGIGTGLVLPLQIVIETNMIDDVTAQGLVQDLVLLTTKEEIEILIELLLVDLAIQTAQLLINQLYLFQQVVFHLSLEALSLLHLLPLRVRTNHCNGQIQIQQLLHMVNHLQLHHQLHHMLFHHIKMLNSNQIPMVK